MSRMPNHNKSAPVQFDDAGLGPSFSRWRGAAEKASLTGTASAAILCRNRPLDLVVALVLILAVWPGCPGQAAQSTPAYFGVGFSASGFINVDRNDAEAGFKAILGSVVRKRKYNLDTRLKVFDQDSAFEAAIKDGTVMLAIIDAWSYLTMDLRAVAKPFFVSTVNGNTGRRYVILTRRESGLKTLADLRGKDIVEFRGANASLGQPWIETLLFENHLGTPESFFGRVDVVGKATYAVLPVFFGKKPACLVDEPGFDIMKELNPQVGQALQVVAISEPFVNAVICLSNSGWVDEQAPKDMILALGELHLEPAGQQILTLFKTGQLVPFQEKHLETVRKLRTTYERSRTKKNP